MWKDFWALSRSEQRAFSILATLLTIMMVVLIVLSVVSSHELEYHIVEADFSQSDDGVLERPKDMDLIQSGLLNPNDISIKRLESLGFKPRAILNWKKYLEAGGRFNEASDIYAVYGIDSLLVDLLLPHLCFDEARPAFQAPSQNHNKQYSPPSLCRFKFDVA
ncbi:MAG: hypothetical protein QM786_14050 [Breznakibacter sp.]